MAEDRPMRLRFWIGILAAVVVGGGRRGRLDPRLQARRTANSTRASRKRRRGRRARRSRSGRSRSASSPRPAPSSRPTAMSPSTSSRSSASRWSTKTSSTRPPSSTSSTSDERAHYEREQGFPILERGPDGKLVKAKRRPIYYPLTYTASQRAERLRDGGRLRRRHRPGPRPLPDAGRRRRPRDRDRGDPAAARRHRHQRLQSGLPRRGADRNRAAAPPRPDRLRRGQLPAEGPRRGGDHHAAQRRHRAARRRQPDRDRAEGGARRPGPGEDPDRRPHLAPGRPRPRPPGRQHPDPLRRRRAGDGRRARLADLGLEPRGADAQAAARGRRRLAQRAADAAALRAGGARGDGPLAPRRHHRRAADARPRPLQVGQRLATGTRRATG